jgi:hypothetical protein
VSEVINLRQQRKAKVRTGKEKQAEQNRLVHGQTKTEKQRSKLEAERTKRHLDGHKQETDVE